MIKDYFRIHSNTNDSAKPAFKQVLLLLLKVYSPIINEETKSVF